MTATWCLPDDIVDARPGGFPTPAPEEAVAPPAPAPPPTPSPSWSKNDIVSWLDGQAGVLLTKKALSALTKAELLDLVDSVLNGETD